MKAHLNTRRITRNGAWCNVIGVVSVVESRFHILHKMDSLLYIQIIT